MHHMTIDATLYLFSTKCPHVIYSHSRVKQTRNQTQRVSNSMSLFGDVMNKSKRLQQPMKTNSTEVVSVVDVDTHDVDTRLQQPMKTNSTGVVSVVDVDILGSSVWSTWIYMTPAADEDKQY